MNKLEVKISKSEKNFLTEIDSYVKACFKDIWLPSHDLLHHRRVWAFAKELLIAYEASGYEFNNDFIEGLMVACYFHDVGMIKTIAPEHGEASAEIANEFLGKGIEINAYIKKELLEAIENHDNKEYLNVIVDVQKPSIYMFLTVADDLDAFGALGLYRYVEIYQMRKMAGKEMATAILANVKKRFKFVEKILAVSGSIHQIHHSRYQKVINFAQAFSTDDFIRLGQLIEMKQNIETHVLSGNLNKLQTAINDELKAY